MADDAIDSGGSSEASGSFRSDVALTFATRLLMLIGVVGSSVVAGRYLRPEGLGTLAVLNATVMLALQIGTGGLPSANTYFIARDRQSFGPVWANTIVFAFAAGSILAVLVVTVAEFTTTLFGDVSTRLLAIAAISIPFQLLTLLGLNVLLAIDRIAEMNILDSMAPAAILVNAIVVLLILKGKLTMLVSFNTAATILLSVSLVLVVGRLLPRQKKGRKFRPDLRLFKTMLAYGVKFYISIMAGFVSFPSDLPIVDQLCRVGAARDYYAAL